MATETQELKLVVSLDDGATAGLQRIRSQMQEMASGAGAGQMERFKRQTDEVSRKIKEMAEATTNVGKAVSFFTSGFGAAGVAVTAFGGALYEGARQMGEYAKRMSDLGSAAQRMGTSAGQLKNVTDQLERMGISAQKAQQLTTEIIHLQAEAQRPYSQIFQQMRERTPDQAGMEQYRRALAGAKDQAEALNIVRQAFWNVERANVQRFGERGAFEVAQQWLKVQGISTDILNIQGNLQSTTAEQIKLQREMQTNASEYLKLSTGVEQKWTDITNLLKDEAIGPGGPFTQMLKNADSLLGSILKKLEESHERLAKVNKELPAPTGFWQQVNPFNPRNVEREKALIPELHQDRSLLDVMTGSSAGQGTWSKLFSQRTTQPATQDGPTLSDMLGTNLLPAAPPGTVAAPARLVGGGWDQFRPSTNIEDDRRRGDLLDQNTKELKQLNDILMRVLIPGGATGIGGPGSGLGLLGSVGGGGGGGLGGLPGTPSGGGNIGPSGPAGGGSPYAGLAGMPHGSAVGPGTGAGAGESAPQGGGGAAGGGVSPIQTRGGKVDAQSLYRSAVQRFRGSPLDGFVPADGAKFGITKGTPEEWARLATAVGMQESGLQVNPKSTEAGSAGLFQFGAQDLARRGLGSDVTNVNAQLEATAREFEQARKSGIISGQSGGRWVGPSRYFGSLRRPNETLQHMGEAGRVAQAAGPVPAAAGRQSQSGPAGDPTVPSDILSRARAVAITHGPAGVSEFMRQQGYPKAGNWCGEFAASVVKSAGYTPPRNPEVASNWRNFGTLDPTPHPGDIAVAGRGVRTGALGSHVTFVENYDPSTGTFTGLGGNQRAGFESRFRAGGYEFRRPPQMDGGDEKAMTAFRSAGGSDQVHRVEAAGHLRVDVNAPAGTRVAAGGTGAFKQTHLNRQTQMEPARVGPTPASRSAAADIPL